MDFQIYEKNDVLVALSTDGVLLSVAGLCSGSNQIEFTLNEEEADFFSNELSTDLGETRNFNTDTDTANEIIRHFFSIEAEEVLKTNNNELTRRGKMAVRLIDIIHGPYEK